MESWAVPYVIPFLLMFVLWMAAIHRQILFWLYLWQLKEYHIGRFLAHFETSKGKSLFINPLFFIKLALLIFGIGYYFIEKKVLLFVATVFAVFFIEACRAAWGF